MERSNSRDKEESLVMKGSPFCAPVKNENIQSSSKETHEP